MMMSAGQYVLTMLLPQVTLAIGGWNEGSEKYSKMAANPRSRRTFAESALRFIQYHNFDGLGKFCVVITSKPGETLF